MCHREVQCVGILEGTFMPRQVSPMMMERSARHYDCFASYHAVTSRGDGSAGAALGSSVHALFECVDLRPLSGAVVHAKPMEDA